MRYLSADIIYPISRKPIINGAIAIADDGEIIKVFDSTDKLPEGQIEFFEGVLCPGFINTHCHLELSHLKGKVTEHKHIDGFVKELQSKREATAEAIQAAITHADAEMYKNGIVAVGDISNGNATFTTKQKSSISYHTFIELFGFDASKAAPIYSGAKLLQSQLEKLKLRNSIVPHSPYSVSPPLFNRIKNGHLEGAPICIHNQENKDENAFYQTGTGRLAEMLKSFGLSMADWKGGHQSSIQGYLHQLPTNSPLLFVHNTFTSAEDIDLVIKSHPAPFWCFCPNANQYIEDTLPNIPLFLEKAAKCTIGTDSLASNYSLSVLDELKVISKAYPSVPTKTLLEWATINGAEFLGLSNHYGSFEKGKKPGINWLKNTPSGKITQESAVEKVA